MKKVEKSIDEMMNALTPIQEDQLGMLQGGFATIGGEDLASLDVNIGCKRDNEDCTINSGNCVAGCGGGGTTTPTVGSIIS